MTLACYATQRLYLYAYLDKMILGEDPKHVSQLNVNLSLILSLCLSPILSLSLRLEARG